MTARQFGWAVWAIVVVATPSTAFGQTSMQVGVPATVASESRDQEHPTEPQWFLEPSSVAFVRTKARSVDVKGHAAEVYSMNHLAMFPRQNSSRYDDWIQTSRVRNRFTLTLGTVIRAYDGASVPIQTPSIYFAGRWQRLKHRRTPSSSIIWMYGAGVAHHSNGQDGCTFENQTRVNGACQSQPAGSGGVLNTKDGSFGVNYIEVRAARSSRTIVDSVEVGTALTLGLDYRFYVPWKFPPGGSGLTQIQHLFGRSEFQGLFQQEWPTRRLWKLDHLQLTLRGSTRFGGGSAVATSGSADVAWFGFAGGTAGPFVRLYSGNDYYNIRFLEERRYLMAGVVWDRARLTRFPRIKAPKPAGTHGLPLKE